VRTVIPCTQKAAETLPTATWKGTVPTGMVTPTGLVSRIPPRPRSLQAAHTPTQPGIKIRVITTRSPS
jgi:hypothetical protein